MNPITQSYVKQLNEQTEEKYKPHEVLKKFAFWNNKNLKNSLENMAQDCLICGVSGGDCFDS